MNKALSVLFTLGLLTCIGLGVYQTLSVQREAAYYQQQVDAITTSLEAEAFGDRSELWMKSLNVDAKRAAVQYYIPPQKSFLLGLRDLSQGFESTEVLLELPAASVSREGILFVESTTNATGGELFQIHGLSDRPITISVDPDKTLIKTNFLLELLPRDDKKFDRALQYKLGQLIFGNYLFHADLPDAKGKQLPSNSVLVIAFWRAELRATSKISDDEKLLVIYEATPQVNEEP